MSERRLEAGEGPLVHLRQRYLLYCLYRYSTPLKLADVAEQVLVWEREGHPEDYLRERLHTYNDLYHQHLPVLREAGLVTYEQCDDTVRPGPALSEAESELEWYLASELGDLLSAEREAFGDGVEPVPVRLYRALGVPERRHALHVLLDRPETPLAELAEALAGWQSARTGAVDPETRAQVLEDLRVVHLPALEEVGLVDYDAEAGTVVLSSLTDPVREVIRSAASADADRSAAVSDRRVDDGSGGTSTWE